MDHCNVKSILEIESVLHNIATVHCLKALVLSITVLTPCWGQRFTPDLFGANIFKNSKSLLNYPKDTCSNHICVVGNKELKDCYFDILQYGQVTKLVCFTSQICCFLIELLITKMTKLVEVAKLYLNQNKNNWAVAGLRLRAKAEQ